jgi:hypothetical protein
MDAAHACIQDRKIRDLCDKTGRMDERVKVLERNAEEIFVGEDSMKSRLIEAECGITTITNTIRSSSKALMWFLGIMVTIQVAAFGGLALYSSRQAEAPSAVTIQTPHDYADTDNFGG